MNPLAKLKWLEAARSKKYKQGKGTMNRGGLEFCILGLLCDVYANAHGIDWGVRKVHGLEMLNRDMLGATASLPDEVLEWAALKSPDPKVKVKLPHDGVHKVNLSMANDQGVTFEVLADAIEAQL